MNSFAITFGIAETGVFQGISQDVTLICRDELVHARAGKELIKIDIAEINKIRPQVQSLFDDIMSEEKEWNAYLFSEGRQCVGINENLSNEYVDFLAKPVAELLNLREVHAPEDNPYPFMDGYIDSSKTQVAAQELQLTAYLLNSIQIASDETIENTLARLRKELEG
jgi:ribonucleoside-diphosphate reductase beta chain